MSSLRNRKSLSPFPILLVVLLVISIGFAGYYFKKYSDLKATSTKTAEQINQELISEVSKVYQLPEGEEPVVLNVNKDPKDFTTDQEKVFSQTFKDLKKDDVVLLYEKAALAVQYRPGDKKVISTATLSIKAGTNVSIIATAETQSSLESTLTSLLGSDIRIGGKSTPSGQYGATTVVDLSGQKADLAKKIADAIGGTVASVLPSTEKAPEGAEIVVVAANTVATEPLQE